jgi:hypothetical protein
MLVICLGAWHHGLRDCYDLKQVEVSNPCTSVGRRHLFLGSSITSNNHRWCIFTMHCKVGLCLEQWTLGLRPLRPLKEGCLTLGVQQDRMELAVVQLGQEPKVLLEGSNNNDKHPLGVWSREWHWLKFIHWGVNRKCFQAASLWCMLLLLWFISPNY